MPAAKPIPDGFHTVTPYLVVKDASRAIDFYEKAFGAIELNRCTCEKSGRILNAKIRIGDSIVMLNDEFPEYNCIGPSDNQPASVAIHLFVENVDRFTEQAVTAGATLTLPVADVFWGDRFAKITDPFHHQWSIATHIEDVSPEEIKERAKSAFA